MDLSQRAGGQASNLQQTAASSAAVDGIVFQTNILALNAAASESLKRQAVQLTAIIQRFALAA